MCTRSEFLSARQTQSGLTFTTVGSALINGKRHRAMEELREGYDSDIAPW